MRFFSKRPAASEVPDFALPSRSEGGITPDLSRPRVEPFSPFSPPPVDRSSDLILAKLDLIMQRLDNIDRRLAELEKIAKE